MRRLDRARKRGRECRQNLSNPTIPLVEQLKADIRSRHRLHVVAVNREQLEGGNAELRIDQRLLLYADDLSQENASLVLAHELGHLELHPRLRADAPALDAILGSAYLSGGAGAVARYSPRMREEAEATAFAVELICPSEEVFLEWKADPTLTTQGVAARWRVPLAVAQAQLGEALHELAFPVSALPVRERPTPTPTQIEAATTTGRPVIVDAGPGTGKTETLIHRVKWLLGAIADAPPVPPVVPESILILTFSNEAVDELRDRMEVALGSEVAQRLTVMTFHGFGMHFLHQHGHHLGLATDFRLLDEDGQRDSISELLGEINCDAILNVRDPSETADEAKKRIAQLKDRLIPAERCALEAGRWAAEECKGGEGDAAIAFAALYAAYEEAKRRAGLVDFADLIMLPCMLMGERPDIAEAYRSQFQWVMVDEFQDVTKATAILVRRLCGPSNPPWVVGDARQAIYRFLGAEPANVLAFEGEFPGAARFDLVENFRSSLPIVAAANELAALLEGRSESGARWHAATDVAPSDVPILVARADSDEAEYEGITRQVRGWLSDDIPPGDIAVLARRNVDVRRIVLALAAAGIRAVPCGLLSADGAGGDLAAALALGETPRAAIPRVAHALGRMAYSLDAIRTAIKAHLGQGAITDTAADVAGAPALALEIQAALPDAKARDSDDGLASLIGFLFDRTMYLRRIVEAPDSAERAMALVEITSVLSLAANYRLTAKDEAPMRSRIAVAERLRVRATRATSIPMAPVPRGDVVRVMTCHAAKGLEFPFVCVAGQARSDRRWASTGEDWLPPRFRPDGDADGAQADAVLFVGLTRAKRAVVVSYASARRKGGEPRSVVHLLVEWLAVHNPLQAHWVGEEQGSPEVVIHEPWGGQRLPEVAPYLLHRDSCSVRTYLEHGVHIRFRERIEPRYPRFVGATRAALAKIVDEAEALQAPVSVEHARGHFLAAWESASRGASAHPHDRLYERLGREAAEAFAAAYLPGNGVVAHPELLADVQGVGVKSDVVAIVRGRGRPTTAIVYRPESLGDGVVTTLKWSAIRTAKVIGLVVAELYQGPIVPLLFSGRDQRLYRYRWSEKGTTISNLRLQLEGKAAALAAGQYSANLDPYRCDPCPLRIVCPAWLESAGPAG